MLIVIPSKGRATKQITLRSLPISIRDRIWVVVEPQESSAYSSFSPQLITLAENNRGIGYARQQIVNDAVSCKINKVLMMDDDLTFAIRRADDSSKFRAPTDEDLVRLFMELEDRLEAYAHVAVASREGGNRRVDPYIYNTRAQRVIGFRVDKLKEYGIRFDEANAMEDFTVQLSLLLKGEPHFTINWAVQNQSGSNSVGGMSTYRTMEVQGAAARALQARFPKYVKVVTKSTKTAWGGQTREDVVVSWKKAYEDGKAHRLASVLDKREKEHTELTNERNTPTVD